MKILIIQQKMIGDVLTSSIIFKALRSQYPDAELHYLIQPHTIAVVKNNPYINKILFDRQDPQAATSSLSHFIKSIQAAKYDAIIDVYSKIETALITGFSGSKIRVGYKKWYTKYFYTHTYTYSKKPKTQAGLAIENRLKLLQPFEADFPKVIKPKIYLKDKEIAFAKALLKQHELNTENKIIMIGMLGSNPAKTYPLPYLAKLLEVIVNQTNAQLLLNYIPEQQSEVGKLLTLCPEHVRVKIFPKLYAKSLRGFIALCALCDALIGNEGGAVNMAKALNVPTFSIYSPWISKEAWDSFSSENHVAVHLKDFKPELFKNKNIKEIKNDVFEYYTIFKPKLITTKLTAFLNKLT